MSVKAFQHIRSGIRVSADSRLPRNLPFDRLIGEDPALVSWWTAKPVFAPTIPGGAYDGLVGSVTDRKAGSTQVFSEGTSSAKPSLDLDGGPRNKPTLVFDTSGSDKLTYSGLLPLPGDMSWVALFKSNPAATTTRYLGLGSGPNRWLFTIGTPGGLAKVQLRCGPSGPNEAVVDDVFTPGAHTLAIATWQPNRDGAGAVIPGGTVGLRVNKNPWRFVYNAASIVEIQTYVVSNGQMNGDKVTDEQTYSVPLGVASQVDRLDLIRDYHKFSFGMDV